MFYTRKKIPSFKPKPSKHLKKVKDIYNIDPLVINRTLVQKTGCPKPVLQKLSTKVWARIIAAGRVPIKPPSHGVWRVWLVPLQGDTQVNPTRILFDNVKNK